MPKRKTKNTMRSTKADLTEANTKAPTKNNSETYDDEVNTEISAEMSHEAPMKDLEGVTAAAKELKVEEPEDLEEVTAAAKELKVEEPEDLEEVTAAAKELKVEEPEDLEEVTAAAKELKVEEPEDLEDLSQEEVSSILESLLFATDRPQGLNLLSQAFKGTNITTADIKKSIELLKTEYAEKSRGITLDEVGGGFQLRTKIDNLPYMKRMIKTKVFKLSPPSLEVLSIVAYKQPCIKATIDEIRGVESGHLLRALMDRGLMSFLGKSELPGKPMLYGTTKKFLEIFSLRNIRELPSLAEIDALLPDGIGEVEEKEETLSDLTQNLSEEVDTNYSQSEEELEKITDKLGQIKTSLNLSLSTINKDAEERAAESDNYEENNESSQPQDPEESPLENHENYENKEKPIGNDPSI